MKPELKECKSKITFKVSFNGMTDFSFTFTKNDGYRYYIGSETYFVVRNEDDIDELFKGFPFSEEKFLEFFDNRQESRDEKINILLK